MGQASLLILLLSLVLFIQGASQCTAGYFESHPGYSLYGHVIRRMKSVGIWSCMLECRRSMMCFSLNVWTDKNGLLHCELNKSTMKANPKDYRRESALAGKEYLELIPNKLDRWSQSYACSSDREVLPNGWYRYQSSAYKFVKEKLTNQMAREHCFNMTTGADLVSLESEEEMEFVKILVQVGATSNDSIKITNDVWIGLNDQIKEDKYVWFDKTPFKYQNWSKDEPNNIDGNENCVLSFPNGKWNDVSCDDNDLWFVCKTSDFGKL